MNNSELDIIVDFTSVMGKLDMFLFGGDEHFNFYMHLCRFHEMEKR